MSWVLSSKQVGRHTRRIYKLGHNFARTMDDATARRKAQMVEDRRKIQEAFPKILEQIVSPACEETNDAKEHVRKSITYNAIGGKMNRGLTVLSSWRHLVADKPQTDEDLYFAIVLAWCVEMLQASFLVADDIMDQSQTRRGKSCWYKKDEIGLVAINDSLMLEASVYRLIDINFFNKNCYPHLSRLLHEVAFQTETGQTLDLITKPGENFANFTLDRYKAIVKWKTAFYSFYLPVALALHMEDITDPKIHESAKEILLEIGEFFQIQDDYLDCYGDPNVTGKIGTDIEETKCSWLLVQALQRVNKEQLEVLKKNYGINDKKAVAKVKEIYAQLDIESVYKEYEETSYTKLMKLIEKTPVSLPKEMFTELVKQIYKRKK